MQPCAAPGACRRPGAPFLQRQRIHALPPVSPAAAHVGPRSSSSCSSSNSSNSLCRSSRGSRPQHNASPRRPQQQQLAEPCSSDSSCSSSHRSSSSSSSSRSRSSSVCHAAAIPLPTDPAPSGGVGTLVAKVRALLFAAWTFTLAVPLFIIMLALAPIVLITDKFRRLAQHAVNNMWACISTWPFYRVQIVGRENLPSSSTPAVYVANHQSFMLGGVQGRCLSIVEQRRPSAMDGASFDDGQAAPLDAYEQVLVDLSRMEHLLDIYSLFHLHRPFKFISKTSNFLIPIVGWSMFLTGHVMLNRVDRRSQLKCLQTCIELLGQGASVLFFPEGTRSKDKVMAGFKKGAFSVAVKAGAPVVPMTLVGTGDVMPSGRESEMYWRSVTIVVHPPIATKGRDADEVCQEARAAIGGALPPELVGAGSMLDTL